MVEEKLAGWANGQGQRTESMYQGFAGEVYPIQLWLNCHGPNMVILRTRTLASIPLPRPLAGTGLLIADGS